MIDGADVMDFEGVDDDAAREMGGAGREGQGEL